MDFYQIDSFTSELFKGNPAGICPLDSWISVELMQKIAMENNLSETAFFVKEGSKYHIRWFTPEEEIDLCGHATLAAAHLILNILKLELKEIHFYSRLSGDLHITLDNDEIVMELPIRAGAKLPNLNLLNKALGITPNETYLARDYMVVLNNEEEVMNIKPDLNLLKQTDAFGVIITAKGTKTDFVSRYFIPGSTISEDPVTGSAHCTLIPYWAEKLKKNKLTAFQMSKRGGYLKCVMDENIVKIYGRAVLYLKGEIFL